MTVRDYINTVNQTISNGWIIAALTDEYIVNEWPLQETDLIAKEEKILEVLIFNESEECKLSRSDIGKPFAFRRLSDRDDNRDTYDELQFLDIDETKDKDAVDRVTSTGGGKYKLPLTNIKNARIRIRYYLGKYDATGQARIEDWRIVEFMEGV